MMHLIVDFVNGVPLKEIYWWTIPISFIITFILTIPTLFLYDSNLYKEHRVESKSNITGNILLTVITFNLLLIGTVPLSHLALVSLLIPATYSDIKNGEVLKSTAILMVLSSIVILILSNDVFYLTLVAATCLALMTLFGFFLGLGFGDVIVLSFIQVVMGPTNMALIGGLAFVIALTDKYSEILKNKFIKSIEKSKEEHLDNELRKASISLAKKEDENPEDYLKSKDDDSNITDKSDDKIKSTEEINMTEEGPEIPLLMPESEKDFNWNNMKTKMIPYITLITFIVIIYYAVVPQ